MEKISDTAALQIMRDYHPSPATAGYILFVQKNTEWSEHLLELLQKEFDDVGVALALFGGLKCDSEKVTDALKRWTNWDNGRIDRAITRAKLYYFYYSRFSR